MDIFDFMHERFKFKHRPIRLFETFAGIGTQRMALNRLLGKENVKCVGISEIDKYALMSYEAIHGDLHNYGDITKINGKDLPEIDILTWSFPCQDLSKAGNQKGLKNTRSGLGYEVIRIVEEMEVKPKVLLMENVPDLLSEKFKKGWHLMFNEIEKLGYSNYVETLNSKNYGVAQNRERVFMVSILGDYTYTFPKGFKLVKKLKDYLENEIDEKYYLSDKQIQQITSWNAQQKPLENAKSVDDDAIQTITAKSNTSMNASMLLIKDKTKKDGKVVQINDYEVFDYRYDEGIRTKVNPEIAITLTTNVGGSGLSGNPFIKIPEATKQGYKKASVGDGIYTNRPHQKRGTVQKNMIPTIKTQSDDVGFVVENNKKLFIRKLTPLECWRLMGIDDEDFFKAEKVVSNTQLYKQAGNAIVVDVLYYLFKNMF